uniref:Uncharacterized protein n=1 Tax=Ananas comosus var. bracteatus TaxID=296719 RepID=A0A6V7PNB9_ANACO|nr:unnamed protein product [Ananas comosus var. bracteatus]
MEGWGKPQLQRRNGHRYGNGNGNGSGYGCDNPSFSSTLLDAIYRSIDESDGRGEKHRGGGGGAAATHRPVPVAAQKKSGSYGSGAAASDGAGTRLKPGPSTSSSSECSSYGGFSSSEAESGPGSARLRPIRTGVRSEQAPAPPIRSPRRSAKPPASPGARIASFVASLFAAAARSPRRPKAAAAAAPPPPPQPRSCLSRTPSTRDRPRPRAPPPRGEEGAGKRSVRFHAASAAAGEDRRTCGHRRVHDGDRAAAEARRVEGSSEGLRRRKRIEGERRELGSLRVGNPNRHWRRRRVWGRAPCVRDHDHEARYESRLRPPRSHFIII